MLTIYFATMSTCNRIISNNYVENWRRKAAIAIEFEAIYIFIQTSTWRMAKEFYKFVLFCFD